MQTKRAPRLILSCVVLGVLASPATAKNTIRWASQGDALTADPHAVNEATTISAARNVYGSLVYSDKDLNFIPWLATSWKLLDPTTWEFKLREGVRWHDGSPFTAADVKFTFERAGSKTSDFRRHVATVKEVRVVNDHLVHIVTNAPNPILPNQLSTLFMMSKSWSEKHGVTEPQDRTSGEETYAVRHAMGTGPFELKLREPDVRTVLVKNRDWWGLERFPHAIDEIVYTPIANQATRVAALLSGEIDLLLDVPLQDLGRLEKEPEIRISQTAQDRTIFFGFNQGKPELLTADLKGRNPFKDRRVRQAFYQAIDIEAIRSKIMRGYAEPAGIITAPMVHGHTKALDTRLPHDPAAARQLLAEAGYPDGFSIRVDCPNNRYINDEAICLAVVAMLAKVGIKPTLSALPKTLHFPKIQKRETDFYMLGWGVPTLDSHYVFTHLVRSGTNTWNGTGFSDPEIDRIIDEIEVETDFGKRDQLIAKVWNRVKDEIMYIPLHNQTVVWAMRDNIEIPISADNGVRFIYTEFKRR